MSDRNNRTRPKRGRPNGAKQQIIDGNSPEPDSRRSRYEQPNQDEQPDDAPQVNNGPAETVEEIIKKKGDNFMLEVLGELKKQREELEDLKKTNEDQAKINEALQSEIDALKESRKCAKCNQSVEASKSWCGTCVHNG